MSEDPSFTDTPTLLASLRRDIGVATARLREAAAFLDQAMSTAWELDRRLKPDRVIFSDPQDPSDLRPLHERVISPDDLRTPPKD